MLALAGLLAPAAASAAPLSELPPTALAGSGSCLHATGAAGELLHDAGGPIGRPTPIELLRGGPGGFAPAGTALLGDEIFACAAVGGRPDGAAVLAGIVPDPQGRPEIVAADRSPGRTFGAPVVVARPGGRAEVVEVAAARSAGGDAVVAWVQATGSRGQVFASLRPAGGTFGAPVAVDSGPGQVDLVAGMSAGGDAVLAWSAIVPGDQLGLGTRVMASIAPAGGRFGGARVVARDGRAAGLAVADDGRTLLALSARRALRVAERPPGGAFGAPVRLARTSASQVAVVLAGGGRAAVVWASAGTGAAGVATRAASGAFSRPVTLAHGSGSRRSAIAGGASVAGGGDLGALAEARVAAALTPDGVLAAWLAPRRVAGLATTGVRTAFVPAGGGPVERSALAGGLRDATSVTAYPTAGGGAGVAWLEMSSARRALLHAAEAAGTRPPDPPAPTVSVGAPLHPVLKWSQALGLRVACSAACDLRAQAPGGTADGTLSLSRAGHGVLRIQPLDRPIARLRGGRVRLRLLYGAPGAAHPAVRAVSVRLRLRALPGLPRAHAVRARRLPGDRIRVTWTTDVASRQAGFVAIGQATRGGQARAVNAIVHPRTRRRFALVLHHVRGVRFVTLYTFAGFAKRQLVVRVR
jgi:hypothetical protein